MDQDERAIRQWFDTWLRATREGELELMRTLIADDAVFLVPGAGRMDKESVAVAATASDPNTDFDLRCTIDEIEVVGDHAWLVAGIALTVTDERSGARSSMAGHSLSILKREGDGWVLVRDANTLAPTAEDPPGGDA